MKMFVAWKRSRQLPALDEDAALVGEVWVLPVKEPIASPLCPSRFLVIRPLQQLQDVIPMVVARVRDDRPMTPQDNTTVITVLVPLVTRLAVGRGH